MSNSDKDKVLADFTAAYEKAHGKQPVIEAKGGWYSVDGGKNVRLAQLEEMIPTLGGDSKPSSKKATVKKPATKKKAKAKSGSGDFSVKAFWAEKISQDNAGAILPR